MGRRKNVIAPETKALDKMQADRENADQLWGDGLPFDQFRLEAKLKSRNSVTAEFMIQNGRDYHWLKAYIPHGEFEKAIKRTGVSCTWAYYCMRATDMFAKSSHGEDLELNFRQIRALTVLEKPVVDEYLGGGSLGDIPHDEVSQMTGGELEKETRRLREKLKRTESVFKEKNRQKDEQIATLELEAEECRHLSKKEMAAKKAGSELDKQLKRFNAPLQDAIFAMNQCIDIITVIQRLEEINYSQLNDFILYHTNAIAMITETFAELQGAINDIHIDKGETADA
ncbi:MAG: hypothetical protein LBI28_12650 [Treponema sp.]|jgi:hypothetical protein|nr:hypothetical protein [Treponema sp.]